VFIAWQGFTIYADRFDTDDVLFRAVMLAAMLAIAALAVQIPDVTHGRSTGFAVAYVVLRSLLVGLYVRAYRHVPRARPLIVRYGTGYAAGTALWLGSLAIEEPARFLIWGVALVFEYSLPILSRRLHGFIPIDVSHLPERFALFTLIVLGESVVSVALGTADSDWRPASAASAMLGFVAVAALWWVYFDVGAGLRVRRAPGRVLLFAYIHIPLLVALTSVAAGVNILIEQSGAEHLDLGARVALGAGTALYLGCLTSAQATTARQLSRPMVIARVVAGAAGLLLIPAGTMIAPVGFAGVLAVVLALLAVVESALLRAA
jgi:low temperature requirement protein LtrA